MSVENLSVNALSLGVIVSMLVGLLKAWIPGNGAQNASAVRLLAIVLGVAGQFGNYLLNTPHPTGPGIEGALGIGFAAGVAAIGSYHVYAGQLQQLVGAVTPAPIPMPVKPVSGVSAFYSTPHSPPIPIVVNAPPSIPPSYPPPPTTP